MRYRAALSPRGSIPGRDVWKTLGQNSNQEWLRSISDSCGIVVSYLQMGELEHWLNLQEIEDRIQETVLLSNARPLDLLDSLNLYYRGANFQAIAWFQAFEAEIEMLIKMFQMTFLSWFTHAISNAQP